ncbi:DNA repair protein RadA, partial [Candidatus Gottesmanbacteria bacterium]|nr:DNA repair protein RadA [Candidatus Gottesmanbacteria bacterium]
MKMRSSFVCQQCGYESPSWMGKCPQCGEWNSLVETTKESTGSTPLRSKSFAGQGKRLVRVFTTPGKSE